MNAPLPAGVTTQSLRRHLEALEAAGRLHRFGEPADVDNDVSAVSYKTYTSLNKACLFTNPSGFPGWEVASQLVMDRSMWAIALGVPEAEVSIPSRAASPGRWRRCWSMRAPCRKSSSAARPSTL